MQLYDTEALVTRYRKELEETVSILTLRRDLVCIAESLIESCAQARNARITTTELLKFRASLHELYLSTRNVLSNVQQRSDEVVNGEHDLHSVLSSNDDDDGSSTALELLQINDTSRVSILNALVQHTKILQGQSEYSQTLIESIHLECDSLTTQAKTTSATCESLQRARAEAWHTHTHLLAALREAGVQHREARAASRVTRRRATLASVLGFIEDPALACVQPLLAPVTAYLGGLQSASIEAAETERALLDAKRRHRASSRAALDDLADATRAIRFLGGEHAGCARRAELASDSAQSLRRVAAALQRIEALFRSLEGWCDDLDTRALRRLLGTGAKTNTLPIKRRAAQHMARWRALAGVIGTCVTVVDSAASAAAELLSRVDTEDASMDETERSGNDGNGAREQGTEEGVRNGRIQNEVVDLTGDDNDNSEIETKSEVVDLTES